MKLFFIFLIFLTTFGLSAKGIAENKEIDCIILQKSSTITPKTENTVIFIDSKTSINLKIKPKSKKYDQSHILVTQMKSSDNLQIDFLDQNENKVSSTSQLKSHQLIITWTNGQWNLTPIEAPKPEKDSFSKSSMRFLAAMTKCSRLLKRDEVISFKRGYFITQHAGVLDNSHILSGFNDTIKHLGQLKRNKGSETISDYEKWHVLGQNGFNFNVYYYVNNYKGSARKHAVSTTLFRHYIWEVLQYLPQVHDQVGKMSKISSFAADDLISFYIGVCIAHELILEMGEDVLKGHHFIETRKKAFLNILNKIGYVSPMDREVQLKYYDIVENMAYTRVIDPYSPFIWSSKYNKNALKEVIDSLEVDFSLTPYIKLEEVE